MPVWSMDFFLHYILLCCYAVFGLRPFVEYHLSEFVSEYIFLFPFIFFSWCCWLSFVHFPLFRIRIDFFSNNKHKNDKLLRRSKYAHYFIIYNAPSIAIQCIRAQSIRTNMMDCLNRKRNKYLTAKYIFSKEKKIFVLKKHY